MKKILMFAFVGFIVVACSNAENDEAIQRLQDENSALLNQLSSKDSTLSVFEESFTTIQRNLALISQREKNVTSNSGDVAAVGENRDEITKDIQAINSLLDENKQALSKLQKQLGKSGSANTGLKKLIDQLNSDIESKESEISYLKENLTAANFSVEILNEMLDSAEFRSEVQRSVIDMQNTALTTAYYAIGTFKELKDQGVVEKDGKVIGLGGSKQLKDDFNKDYFKQVDIVKVRSIALNAKKVKILTSHPSGSYSLDGGEAEKTLTISNPAQFWSASKYLVVEVQ